MCIVGGFTKTYGHVAFQNAPRAWQPRSFTHSYSMAKGSSFGASMHKEHMSHQIKPRNLHADGPPFWRLAPRALP